MRYLLCASVQHCVHSNMIQLPDAALCSILVINGQQLCTNVQWIGTGCCQSLVCNILLLNENY